MLVETLLPVLKSVGFDITIVDDPLGANMVVPSALVV
jgi:hypothetical protein